MAGVYRFASGARRPLLPDFEWATCFIGNADATPQSQKRAADRLAGSTIGFVVCEVGVTAGAVVLAVCVNTQGVRKRRSIVIESTGIKGRQASGLGPACHLPFEVVDGRFRDQHFRQWLRLCQK